MDYPPADAYAGAEQPRRYTINRYNQRLAKRVARRAHLNEPAVAVAFAFNNLLTVLLIGLAVDVIKFVPTFGGLLDIAFSLVTFYFHRIVIVTSERIYVYRDLPFHFPGKLLKTYERGVGVVRLGSARTNWFSRLIRRGQLTFSDGYVVYHGILWIRRAQYIVQEGNIRPVQ